MLKPLILILFFLAACLIVFGFIRYIELIKPRNNSESNLAQQQPCVYTNQLDRDFFLNKYNVKEGDTLLGISSRLLNDSSRIGEIIEINKTLHPGLSNKNPMIKKGWTLHLPPQSFSISSGQLSGIAGKIVKYQLKSVTIEVNERGVQQISYIVPATKLANSSAKAFAEGDCVYIVNDTSGKVEAGIVAMTPQDHNYFKDDGALFSYIARFSGKNKCELYGRLDNSFFTQNYTVKQGDTLESIAQNILNDGSRAEELMNLNKYTYPHLSRQSPFIEVGWVIQTPSTKIPKSSGFLSLMAGEVVEKQVDPTYRSVLYLDLKGQDRDKDTEIGNHSSFFDEKTIFAGKEDFEVGDCVLSLEDGGKSIIVAPQGRKNYFR